MQLSLASIHIYPVKSCGGIEVDNWPVDRLGLHLDRRWMIVDPDGGFITQREAPRLALVRPQLQDDHLELHQASGESLVLPLGATQSHEILVTVWQDQCRAVTVSPAADRWFSELLNRPCRLVQHQPGSRTIPETYAAPNTPVGFADQFPFLLLSDASLNQLNQKLTHPVPMDRFRPNLVITGGPAHFEDELQHFSLGGTEFKVAKPCSRCRITCTDQNSSERSPEPLKTLASYRRQNNEILFGQNLLHRLTTQKPARLSVGQLLEISTR